MKSNQRMHDTFASPTWAKKYAERLTLKGHSNVKIKQVMAYGQHGTMGEGEENAYEVWSDPPIPH